MEGNSKLTVAPLNLRFFAPHGYGQRRTVSLMNPTRNTIFYKVKTNTQRMYSVCPTMGKVRPFDTTEFMVALNANDLEATVATALKHKFIVFSFAGEEDDSREPAEAFQLANINGMAHARIQVIFDPLYKWREGDSGELREFKETSFEVSMVDVDAGQQFDNNLFRPVCDACRLKSGDMLNYDVKRPSSKRYWKILGALSALLCVGAGLYMQKSLQLMDADHVYF